MSTALWIAVRYLRNRRRKFAAFITWVSLVGLALGVLVLTVVISVMNGFDAELKERILGTVPHVVVEGVNLEENRNLEALLSRPDVIGAFNFFAGSGMVTRNGAVNPVTVYGIDENGIPGLGQIRRHMRLGKLEDLFSTRRGIVLGAPLAGHLGLLPGDSVALVISEPTANGINPRLERFTLAGTFEVGAVLDYSLVVVALSSFAEEDLARIGSRGVRLTVTDPMLAPAIKNALAALNADWHVTSWADNFGELFQAVKLEKLLMFLILLMVVAVAAFNIVSGQMMVVNDKRSAIAIMRTMGASTGTIARVFLLQGLLISSVGIVTGLVLGAVIAHNISGIFAAVEQWFGFRFLAGTYFIEVPSVIKVGDLLIIAGISWGLCLLSAWLPARRASLLNPLEGLHQS